MQKDKRKNQRKPFERRAWIDPGEGGPIAECVLGNMSETGAKLIFARPPALPDQFILRLSWDGRVARKCRLAWNSGNEVGVEFMARHVGAPLTRTETAEA